MALKNKNEKDELVLIIGGGPAGLGAALAFHNNDYKNIVVLEARPDMTFKVEDSYPVGVNVRGQNAIKKLFGQENFDMSKKGLRVDQWKIVVGPNINVANVDSGLVYGTSRNEVAQLLYDETQNRDGSIKVMFGYKAKNVDLKSQKLKCENKEGEEKEFQPNCLVIADGYNSRIRDQLAQEDKSLKIQKWKWPLSFRVLISEQNVKTDLNPYVHYIFNQVYTSAFLSGRWTSVAAIKENAPDFLKSNEATDKNVDDLQNYINKRAPKAVSLFTREELGRFFSRRLFSGAITKVSKLVVGQWAVLLGDAAHSAFPATGEGINSALEDCLVLQDTLKSNSDKPLKEALANFEKNRLKDVNCLSDIAYAAAFPGLKGSLQLALIPSFRRFLGPSKEDIMFGKDSTVIRSYSEITKIWHQQAYWFGGPSKAPPAS